MGASSYRLFSVSDEITAPLHFGYLASSIPTKHEVILIDQLRHGNSDVALLRSIVKARPDILGFSIKSKDVSQTKKMLLQIRPLLQHAKIVVGGPQMSLMPCETFKYFDGCIDFGFAGESEIGFSKFLGVVDEKNADSELENIPNLVWTAHGQIKTNARMILENLDSLPFPRWEIMVPASYPKAPHGAFYNQYPYAPMITSRGCPYACTFCSAGELSGKRMRYRSVDNVFEEIKYLNSHFGVKEIHFEDDNFSVNKKRAIDLSERLLTENLGITWAFPNGLRLGGLDLDTLKLMRKAGCYAVNVGIESGNDERLRKIKKRTTKAQIRENVSRAKKAGLDVGGFFIIGFPGEKLSEMRNTINFALELELDRIGLSYFQPYPGSEDYKTLCEAGNYRFDFDNEVSNFTREGYFKFNLLFCQIKVTVFE